MKTGKVYFPNLNAIRFIAAFMVVFHHIEQFKLLYKIPANFDQNSPFYLMGKLGVVLFFVLSGFLITFLLLKEEAVTGQISIRDFYIRRVLKIWPLYFLIFAIGLYLLPNIPFLSLDHYGASQVQDNLLLKTFFFVFFLPNLMMLGSSNGDGFIPGANQLWSIGTEEQFYLFWPLIFKTIKKNRVLALCVIIVLYLAARSGVAYLSGFRGQNNLLIFLGFFNIDCMAIGGLAAMIYFEKQQGILNFIYNKYFQWILVVAITVFILKGYYFSKGFYTEIYAILFAAFILNFATNPKPIFSLEAKWTNYLGKISYGIYMYHCIAVMVVISVLQYFSIGNNILIYLGTVILTLALASISYRYFEEYFIKMKVKFSKIVSGDNARQTERPTEKILMPVSRVPGFRGASNHPDLS